MTNIEGYELLRELHRGGQGIVYQAIQKSTRRTVAIKVLREGPFAGGSERLRFDREVSILASLNHRHIVGILDRGEAGGGGYLVMEYIDGLPLDRFSNEQSLPLRDRLALFASICDAVSAAHQRGVIHRDLKPGNILIDKSGEPHILDFGLAKLADGAVDDSGAVTQTGQFVGSLHWASPEQALGRHTEVDVRSDVYSLGVILNRLVTGQFPYALVGDLKQILASICHAEPVRPRTVSVEVDDDLETIVLKCLSKEPARRYQSVGELAGDVRRYLNREPIDAKRDSGWYVLRKTLSRHRAPTAAAAAFVLLIAGFATAMSILYRRTAAAEKDEREQRETAVAEAQEARTQAAIAQAVNEFLNDDLLGAVAPSNEPGKGIDMRVREVLARAAERIEGRFADQPLVESAIRLTLGRTYLGLGEFDAAEPHVLRALELRRSILGNDHEETLRAISVAASLDRRAGRFEQAERLYREWYDTSRHRYGDEHTGTLSAMNNLALLYISTGRFGDSEALLRKALDALRRTLGDEHAHTLLTTANLGDACRWLRRYEEAEALLKSALESQRRLLGPDHPDTQLSLNCLIRIYNESGRPAESEPLCRELLEATRRIHGDEHPLTLNALNELGFAYLQQSRPAEAEPYFARNVEIQRRTLGADHPDTLVSQLNLANVYFDKRQFSEAEVLMVQTLAGFCRAMGDAHPYSMNARNGLAMIYTAQARPADAEVMYREMLAIYRRAEPPDELPVANGIALLVPSLMSQAKYAEVETLMRECLDIRKRRLPPEDTRHDTGMSMLGEAVAAQFRFAEAEPLLLESYERLQTSAAPDAFKRMALERIVKLYEAWDAAQPGEGKADLATAWRARLSGGVAASQP